MDNEPRGGMEAPEGREPGMVKFESDPDISTEEGFGTEDIDVEATEIGIEEDPDIRTEEGYGNIDPNLD